MAWFSKSKTDNSSIEQTPSNNFPAQQIEQRAHGSINMPSTTAIPGDIAPSSDIALTISQISTDESSVRVKNILDMTDKKQIESSIAEFVNVRPNNMFVIDGERDIKESIICTNNTQDGGKTCLKMKINNVELFTIMQKMEYFCSLPNDVDATYFECRKIK